MPDSTDKIATGESGEMCAMKEVTLFSNDAKSKESAKQLGQAVSTEAIPQTYFPLFSSHLAGIAFDTYSHRLWLNRWRWHAESEIGLWLDGWWRDIEGMQLWRLNRWWSVDNRWRRDKTGNMWRIG
ncbi:hypothetical protein HHK36_011661 [Tetracentron sinense]|uniref:Uncharacterized protein n=1 Tax=Tetracentron sinense TaxID=13715 RepID=A0A834ZBH6_TETSI|nr:hypothetical protein HHK36_011661 [Tetracentron sinense]